MKIHKVCQQRYLDWLMLLLLGLSLLSFKHSEQQIIANETQPEDKLIIDIEKAVQLVVNNNSKLFAAQYGIRSAELNIAASLSEFNFNITPNAKSGYIGGGTAGTGLSIGGGICFAKKIMSGTQMSMTPSVLRAAKKFNTTLDVRLTQPLFKGVGKEYNLSGVRRAEFAYRSAIRSFYKNLNATILRSIELLYEITKLEEIVLLNQESHARFEIFWKANKIKLKIGLSTALDVNRAEIELRQAMDLLNHSKEALQEAKDALRELLAIPQDILFEVSVPLEMPEEELNLDELIEIALNNRIEVDQGIDQLNENIRLSKIAKKELLPDLNLVLDYSNIGYGEQFTGSFDKKRESRWGIGFTTSTDNNNTREKISYENTIIAIETTKQANSETEKLIILEVKRCLRALYYAQEKISLQNEQILSTQGGLKLAKIKFLREFATNFDVIQAEKAFHTAQIQLLDAFIDYRISLYKLRGALGVMIEKPLRDKCEKHS